MRGKRGHATFSEEFPATGISGPHPAACPDPSGFPRREPAVRRPFCTLHSALCILHFLPPRPPLCVPSIPARRDSGQASASSALKAVPFAVAFPLSLSFSALRPRSGQPEHGREAALSASSAVKAVQIPCQRRGKIVTNIKVCKWHGCEKHQIATKSRQKPAKTPQKTAKKCKFALAHLTQGTPSAEKTALAPAPGPVASKKLPKNTPQNSRKKVIHNRLPARPHRIEAS